MQSLFFIQTTPRNGGRCALPAGRLLWSIIILSVLLVPATAQTGPRTLWTSPAFDPAIASDQVTGLALPPNATYVASLRGVLTRLDDSGSVVRSLPVGPVQRFAAAPDGSVLATGAGLDVTLRDPEFNALWRHSGAGLVAAVAVAAGGARTVVGTRDGDLIFLDPAGRRVAGTKLEAEIQALDLSDDGETLAVSFPRRLLLLDGRGREMWRARVESATALDVAGDGSRIALGDADGRVRVWDREGGERFSRSFEPHQKITALALSRNGSFLVAAWRKQVVAVSPDYSTPWLQTFALPVEALALSRNGSLVAVAIEGGLVYGLATGFAEKAEPLPRPPNATRATPAPPAETPTPPAAPPPVPPAPPPAGLLVGGGAGALAVLVVLHKRGVLLLPGWQRVEKGAKALPRRLAALRGATKPKAPGPAPRRPPAALRTPRVSPGTARLLRERAREQKTLENLDYMKERALLEEGKHRTGREETEAKLKEIKQALEEMGYKG